MKEISLEERIVEMQGVISEIKNQMDDVIQKAYEQAVKDQDEDAAADLARKIRDKMLKESDSEYALDRLNLDLHSMTAFIKSLKELVNNEWGVYRKELRNLPEQPGFPFNVKFPKKPE